MVCGTQPMDHLNSFFLKQFNLHQVITIQNIYNQNNYRYGNEKQPWFDPGFIGLRFSMRTLCIILFKRGRYQHDDRLY